MNFLSYLENKYVLSTTGSQLKLSGMCPFCLTDRQDLRLYIDPKKGVGICFHCSQGFNAIRFVMAAEGVSWRVALGILNEDEEFVAMVKDEPDETQIPWPTLEELENHPAAVDYLEGRGIDLTMAGKLNMKFAPFDMQWQGKTYPTGGRIVTPIYDITGNPVAWQGRHIGKSKIKYFTAPGFDKASHLFNANVIQPGTPFLILVEGIYDLMGWYRAGVKRVVASLGKFVSEEQVQVLRYLRPGVLFLALDVDASWQQHEFVEKHGYCFADVRLIKLAKDADEMGKADLFKAIEIAKPYSWENKILAELN